MSETALEMSRYAAPVRVLDGFGGSMRSACRTLAPKSMAEMTAELIRANQAGLTVSLRGAGRSYGDAGLGSTGLVLDLNGLDRILSWNPQTGVAEVEPGVPLGALWRRAILDGFWPAVVPGTMAPTMGGMLAMNVHGKNQFKAGVFGEHVRDFDLVTPSGETIRASREENQDVFFAAPGSAGMLGAFSRISLQLKKVESGRMRVESYPARNFAEQFEQMEQLKTRSDYMVSWLDCLASGSAVGRGQIHTAHHLHGSEDPHAKESLQLAQQELPLRIFGFPKAQLWHFVRLFMNDFGVRWTNFAKYHLTVLQGRGHTYLQSHAAFAFLLDYVPNWRLAYAPRGLLQHQLFVPEPAARSVFPEALRRFQTHGVPSYLGVLKRHKPDPFLLSHGVDGWSLALDFPIKKDGGAALRKAAREVTELVLEAGGKFYLAKDQLLEPAQIERAYGGALDRFFAIKQRLDPKMTMQTDQARRLFPERLRVRAPSST